MVKKNTMLYNLQSLFQSMRDRKNQTDETRLGSIGVVIVLAQTFRSMHLSTHLFFLLFYSLFPLFLLLLLCAYGRL